MMNLLRLLPRLSIVFALVSVCHAEPPNDQKQPKHSAQLENPSTDTPTKSKSDAESSVQVVIDETIHLLEEKKYREWAKRYAPPKQRTPDVLEKFERQMRSTPELVEKFTAAFREVRGQSPTYNPGRTEARLTLKEFDGEPGYILLVKENKAWHIKEIGQVRPDYSLKPNLTQLGFAFFRYHAVHKHLPTDSKDKNGTPLLSWRVELLPYLEQAALYDRFRKDEPWDSQHNKALLKDLPTFGAGTNSVHLAPIVEGSILGNDKALKFNDVKDGLAQTAIVVQVGPDAAVPWSKPQDVKVDPKQPAKNFKLGRAQSFLALMADGRVREIPADAKPAALLALFQRDDGKRLKLAPEELELEIQPSEQENSK